MAYGDKCFPEGKQKINGIKPDSFKDHDLRPVDEGYISKLGASFDWLQVCSRCGYEDYGIGPMNPRERTREELNSTTEELEALNAIRNKRLEQIDAHVQTLPYHTGNTTMAKGLEDVVKNCCPQSANRKGWHSNGEPKKGLSYYLWDALWVNQERRVMKDSIIFYEISRLSDYSHYQNKSFKSLLLASIPGNPIMHNVGASGFLRVYECQFCGDPIKAYVNEASRNNSN